ncbi:zinc knuckle domain-containing protein [Histoplasma capsulatum]|uniref:Zinc knuckle domain-containing protein n=1 Tax=Ajellomyces capsulatus TaxID=5037 RepID=A0A8A1M649_AJECA|nr:zinc knuckle domain-containing protein [Histoplasma capsulatum]
MLSSRRACYKCGNIGHYADSARSARLRNAFAITDMSRMVARVLAQQKGLGHVQADCPTLRISGGATGGRCYICHLPGHLARTCPSAGMHGAGRGAPVIRGGFNSAFRGGFAGYSRTAMCYKCGGPNHFARDCQAQAMKCYACGKLGHISRDCPAPNGGPLSSAGKVCYKCSLAGHISRDCPTNTNETVAPSAAEPTTEVAAVDSVAPAASAPTTAVA